MTKDIFIYKPEACITINMIEQASKHYTTCLEREDLTTGQRASIKKIMNQLYGKHQYLSIEENRLTDFVNVQPFFDKNKKELYYITISNIAKLLECKQGQHTPFVEDLFRALLGAMHLEGESWNNLLYTNLVDFPNCFNHKERIVYILHHVIRTGLHDLKEIIKVLNMLFKVFNIINSEKLIGIRIPNARRNALEGIVIKESSTSSTKTFENVAVLT